MLRQFLWLLTFWSFSHSGFSQGGLFSDMLQKYPDKTAVYLEKKKTIEIQIQGDSLKVDQHHREDLMFLNEQSNALAQDKVYTSHINPLQDIEARTLIPEKNKYREVEVTDFVEKDETSSGIFYDDTRSISFVYPAVQPGARGILSYSRELSDPRFLTSFYFASFVPVELSQLEIIAPAAVNLNFRLENTEGYSINFDQKKKGDNVHYTWTAKQVPSLSFHSDAPEMGFYSPHLVYYIENYTVNDTENAVLSSPEDLYQMYSGFIDQLNRESDPTLSRIVDSLTANLSDEQEKVRSIYYWVQDQIKYIAFEDGMRGFIPHDAALVCEKRYGDCKDMASITHHMLQLAGIKSYMTWIGTRDLPYRYSEVPTPLVDNHMITTYEHDGQYVFLDATSKYTPYGFPSSMIQGKEALLSLDSDQFTIIDVPVMEGSCNQKVDSIVIRLVDDTIRGTGKYSLAGYPKVFNAYKMNGLQGEVERNYITSLVEKGNNKFFVTDYTIAGREDRENPFEVQYEFRLNDYYRSIDGEIYLNLSLNKTHFNQLIDTDQREVPVENDYRQISEFVTVLEIPEGFEVEYLPTDQRFEQEPFGFTIQYERTERTVTQRKILYIDYLILHSDQFPLWNQMIEELSEAYREVLILKKKV